MKRLKFTISNKILAGFLVLILIFSANAISSLITINKNIQVIKNTSQEVNPSMKAINDFALLATRSKMLITNWVYLQSNTEDKEALKNLHNYKYPELKETINRLSAKWEDKSQRQLMDSILTNFEGLLKVQKNIMEELVTFEDYEDPIVKFMAEDNLETQILPKFTDLMEQLNEIKRIKEIETKEAEAKIIASSESLKRTILTLGIIILIVGLTGAVFMARSITRPIVFIKGVVQKLGRGELPENKINKFGNDEIGDMAEAVDKLAAGLRSTTAFAEKIGDGHYDSEFDPLSEHDVLGNALLEMRDNLKKVSEEDKRRNWATEGLAKFSETLRNNNDNISKLCDEIISNLIQYLKANQGGLFIINDDDENDVFLELAACYAWDKKKYVEQKVYKGEGLTGQSWLEQDTIYMTEVPDNYVRITSGLGEANPTSILIVPLKVNDEVYGVIEIASFYTFADYEIDFVQRLAESIASTISSVKINARTQRLLEESTELTEQMRAQEEEMRQNMEELQATQEEMQRNNQERDEREKVINSTQVSMEFDPDFNILNANNMSSILLKYDAKDLVGKNIEGFVDSRDNWAQAKATVRDGGSWVGVLKLSTKEGKKKVLKASVGKATNSSEDSSKYLFFGFDITDASI